jgi:uncharacterized RDD family membrane protein YckC
MEYEDRVKLPTPEGVEIELALAGIGSRLCARLIDVLIMSAIAVPVLIALFAVLGDESIEGTIATVIAILVGFLVLWAYDVLFEAFNAGRTPGKQALKLRVVGDRGEPETFSMAAVRNILRIVDEYLTLWLGALISMVRSDRTQRLGDRAAGTLVVNERAAEVGGDALVRVSSLPELEAAGAWDTSRIGDTELATARRFLARRDQFAPHVRTHLADDLAARLRPRVPGSESIASGEQFIELLVAVKSQRG